MESLCQLLREKHHHRKLLPVTTTASTRCKGQGARCKGQDQHQGKSERDAATTWNSNHHHHQPAQNQTGVGGAHNAAIIATCVRAHNKSRAWKKLEWCALTHVAMSNQHAHILVVALFHLVLVSECSYFEFTGGKSS